MKNICILIYDYKFTSICNNKRNIVIFVDQKVVTGIFIHNVSANVILLSKSYVLKFNKYFF